MLKCIRIKNFQSYKDSIVTFSPGLNVITGSSDSGKSAILRALNWVIMNRPMGGEFKSWFSKKQDDTHVVVEFDDGVIGKRRKNDKNTYILPSEGHTLEALRTDLPEEITDITQMADYNIHEQHDKYFLLQDTEGQRARALNELVGLDVIDRLFKNITRRERKANEDIKEFTEKQKILKGQISELSYLEKAEASLLALEDDLKRYDELIKDTASLERLVESIREAESKIEEAEKITTLGPQTVALMSLNRCYIEKANVWASLEGEIETIKKIELGLEDEKNWLSVSISYDELRIKLQSYGELLRNTSKLSVEIKSLTKTEQEIYVQIEDIKTLSAAYGNLLTKSRLCPTCGSGITDKTVGQIIKRLECCS